MTIWKILLLAAFVSVNASFDFDEHAGPFPEERPYKFRPIYHKPGPHYRPHRHRHQHHMIGNHFCFGRTDGDYPTGRCKNKYVSCVNGLATAQRCPAGLVYDPILKSCEVGSQSPYCTGGRIRTTPPTSPIPTMKPRHKPYFSCRHKKNGLYADRRRPCRPYYFSCSNGEATLMHCPDGLYFDPEIQQCDRYANIPACTGRPRLPVTMTYANKAKASKVKPVRFNCKAKPSGNYPNPWSSKPYCSTVYYTCSNGVASKRRCPNPLFYDPHRDICDRFNNVYACTGRRYHPTKPPRTTPFPTVPPVPFDCRHKKNGYYVNPRARCSATYYACVGGIAREMKCQPNLAFDPESGTCQQPSLCRICGGRPLPPTRPTRPPYRPVTRPPPIDCTHRLNGLYRDPLRRCSRVFYSCSNGIAYRMECPSAMAFDPYSQACQLASELYICTGRHTTTPRPTRPTRRPKPVPFDCIRLHNGLYPNPRQRCSKLYYACSNGVASEHECPESLFYDPHRRLCDTYSDVYVCSGRRKPKPRKYSAVPNVRPSKEFDCRGLVSGLYPNPRERCSKNFYQCSNDMAYKLQCGHGLFFDPHERRCNRFHNIYACTGRQQPVYKPRPMARRRPRPEYYRIPVDCIQLGDGDHPEPGVLYGRNYYSCSNGQGVRRECPKGTFFHVGLRRCESLESLRHKHTSAMSRHREARRRISDNGFCSRKANGWYPMQKCSQEFISCSGGEAEKQRCPNDLYFDLEKSVCDYKEHIPACGGRRPKYAPVKVRRPSYRREPLDFDCTTLPDGNYPVSPCSNKFVACSHGQARLEQCPPDLVYCKDNDRCDYSYRVPSCQKRGYKSKLRYYK